MEEMMNEQGSNILSIMMGIMFINLAITVVNIIVEIQLNELAGLI